MVIGLGELIGDAILGDEARVVGALTLEDGFVGVPAHRRAQHFAEEVTVAPRLAFRTRHHRVRDVTEQLKIARK